MHPLRKEAQAIPASSAPLRIARPNEIREKLFHLIKQKSFGRGKIKLASGRESDFYFNMKPTMLKAQGAAWLSELIADELEDLEFDYLGGLEMGAVPIAGAIAAASFNRGTPIDTFFVRKKVKEHGDRLAIEGLGKDETFEGKTIVVIDDVTTTGGSAMQAVQALKEAGGNVVLVLTIVDRQEGAAETFAAAGLKFRALFTADEFLKA